MKNRLVSLIIAVTLLTAASAALAGCMQRSAVVVPVQTRTLHLGHPAGSGTALDILANRIKEYVETRSDGRYNVLVYPDATLGHQQMQIEAMIAGTVDIGIVTSTAMADFASDLGVLDLPFLFSEWDEVNRFLHSEAIGDIYAISDNVGISTLAFMPRGFRHVTSNLGPINEPSDFDGMSIRVLGTPVFIDTFSALGATPEGIPWEQTLAAVASGLVDGKENTIVTLNDYRLYQLQRYLSLTGHFFAFAAVMASPITLSSIPSEDVELIRRAAFDAAISVGAEQREAENEALENLRRNGMSVNDIPDKQPFIDMMAPVYDSFFSAHANLSYNAIRSAINGSAP